MQTIKSFAPLIAICALIALFALMAHKKERPLPQLSAEEKSQYDCETKLLIEQNEQAQKSLDINLEELLKPSVAKTIKQRRLDEAYCLKVANCGYLSDNKKKDSLIYSSTFDACLEDISVQELQDSDYAVEKDYP